MRRASPSFARQTASPPAAARRAHSPEGIKPSRWLPGQTRSGPLVASQSSRCRRTASISSRTGSGGLREIHAAFSGGEIVAFRGNGAGKGEHPVLVPSHLPIGPRGLVEGDCLHRERGAGKGPSADQLFPQGYRHPADLRQVQQAARPGRAFREDGIAELLQQFRRDARFHERPAFACQLPRYSKHYCFFLNMSQIVQSGVSATRFISAI